MPGVRALDHTADVGLVVEAPDLEALLVRAARGMIWLLRDVAPGQAAGEAAGEVRVSLEAEEPAALLRSWLREVLYHHDARDLVPTDVRFSRLEPTALDAVVTTARGRGAPVREIKGVTWHALRAERSEGGWSARVVFDV